ncbi:hypothetical protein GCK72_020650 [Caenorhabditis remanei]|uniref:DUF281 domain-containing protein n=1 Tax=Caenorhabditis remanei TaxID=31234 RepID=A0A6A5GHT0_CAERE|nr:hypothetical protein GCK72_020650 [Caenorhabditis remanei]KAF1754092.1 hypothetical protein GCK72_020650 [Caenorhabditis remanei]
MSLSGNQNQIQIYQLNGNLRQYSVLRPQTTQLGYQQHMLLKMGKKEQLALEESNELCDKCDVNKIAPDLEDPANTYFTFDVDKPATGCQMVFQVHCMRSDTMICENNNIFGTTSTGNRGIATGVTSTSASSTLTCEADGSWSARDVTMISKIVCTFQGCVQP